MSQSEIERFVQDVNKNQALLEKLSSGELGVDGLVEQAHQLGYSFSAEEAKSFAQRQAVTEIDDESLQLVAGGGGQVVVRFVLEPPVFTALLTVPY